MSNRVIYITAVVVGSTVGGYVPTLFGMSIFSTWSIVSSAAFAFAALYFAYKFLT